MNTIYTVTLIDSRDETKIVSEDSMRCIGWYGSLKEAIDAVFSNCGEMHECRYNYIVVESISSGVWKRTDKEWWFIWDGNKKEWLGCEKPLKYNTSNFGIG